MTIFAICGPIGTGFDSIENQIEATIKEAREEDNSINIEMIHASPYRNNPLILKEHIRDAAQAKHVFVLGYDLLMHKELESLFQIKIFVELDEDTALLNIIKNFIHADPMVLENILNNYEQIIKPANENINKTKASADIWVFHDRYQTMLDLIKSKIISAPIEQLDKRPELMVK